MLLPGHRTATCFLVGNLWGWWKIREGEQVFSTNLMNFLLSVHSRLPDTSNTSPRCSRVMDTTVAVTESNVVNTANVISSSNSGGGGGGGIVVVRNGDDWSRRSMFSRRRTCLRARSSGDRRPSETKNVIYIKFIIYI